MVISTLLHFSSVKRTYIPTELINAAYLTKLDTDCAQNAHVTRIVEGQKVESATLYNVSIHNQHRETDPSQRER